MELVEKLQEMLLQFRFHALFLAAFAALVLSLLRLGPSFLTVVSFFWPLLLSTAFFLTAVLVLRFISPPPAEIPSNQTGEEFMDYVASRSGTEHGQEAEGASGADREEAAAAAADVGAGEQGAEAADETKKSQ